MRVGPLVDDRVEAGPEHGGEPALVAVGAGQPGQVDRAGPALVRAPAMRVGRGHAGPAGTPTAVAKSLPVPAGMTPNGDAGAGDRLHAQVDGAVAADRDQRGGAVGDGLRGRRRSALTAWRRRGPHSCPYRPSASRPRPAPRRGGRGRRSGCAAPRTPWWQDRAGRSTAANAAVIAVSSSWLVRRPRRVASTGDTGSIGETSSSSRSGVLAAAGPAAVVEERDADRGEVQHRHAQRQDRHVERVRRRA